MSGCHAGCRELVGEFAAGGASAPPQTHLGRDGSLSRDEHADVRPNCADTASTTPALSMRAKPCARWLHAMEKYALEELSNTVLAAEYRTTLPHDRLLAEVIAQTRRQLIL